MNPVKDQKMISAKPPLPPKPKLRPEIAPKPKMVLSHVQWKVDEENIHQIQKLTAVNEKLRIDVADIRKQLHFERNAVRELRATHDGEYRKLKNETKKLLDVVSNVKKTSVTTSNRQSLEITKLTEELTALRDSTKTTEKKIKHCNCSVIGGKVKKEDNKVDSIITAAKAEIQKLLDELKCKEKEISNLKTKSNLNIDGRSSLNHEMRNNSNSCGGEGVEQFPHPECERYVTHVDCGLTTVSNHLQFNEPTLSATMDSNNNHITTTTITMPHPTASNTTIIEVKESHKQSTACGNGSIETIDMPTSTKRSLDFLQNKYKQIKQELVESRDRIDELEQSVVEQNNTCMDNDRVQDRVQYLEEREKCLEKETHELREQNELLEFRILELEENQDKWSLRSNSTPDSKDVCVCWREKESDDLRAMYERSDSGITSPNSHHLDDQQSVSPCSISLMDQLPTDDMRKHIAIMTKRSFYNEDDKLCFLQLTMLLNSLEALSQDQCLLGDEFSSMDYSMDKFKYSKMSDTPPPPPTTRAFDQRSKQQGKIIATVQPYSTSGLRLYAEPKKEFTSDNAHEIPSVVLPLSMNFIAKETQTEEHMEPVEKTNAELCAEIDKLNRFRQKVEESSKVPFTSSTSSSSTPPVHMVTTDIDTVERRHLKFYQERLKLLEQKVAVYESSGDKQMKLLAERLQREIQLESWVDQLQDAVEKLKSKNMELEENNCELEEIENETRLRWQKMEEELAEMSQRNMELDMTKSTYQEKFEEARDSVEYLEECLHGSEERISSLEEQENELRTRLELTMSCIPAIGLYQIWKIGSGRIVLPKLSIRSPPALPAPIVNTIIDLPEDHPVYKRLNELQIREMELTNSITDLNRAYNETLENADNLWAQMEREYKDKIANYERLEVTLRSKIQQLEKRLLKDTEYAHDRIAALEENELQLKQRVGKLNRDSKEQQKKFLEMLEELNQSKEEHQKLQAYLSGPVTDNLDREKRKLRRVEEDLSLARQALRDNENAQRNEQSLLKRQLQKMHKELKNFEVTNSELREEVETLERRVTELSSLRISDKDKIQELVDELEIKQHQNMKPSSIKFITCTKTLAQELNHKPIPIPRQRTLPSMITDFSRHHFPDTLDNYESGDNKMIHKEVKSLADSIICNAETNGFVPIKRSFVEEVSTKSVCQVGVEAEADFLPQQPTSKSCQDINDIKNGLIKLKQKLNSIHELLRGRDKYKISSTCLSNTSRKRNTLFTNKFRPLAHLIECPIQITSCVADTRDCLLIVNWTVLSFIVVGGYEIYLDGELKSVIPSSNTTTMTLSNVQHQMPHKIAMFIVSTDLMDRTQRFKPALYRYQPNSDF